MVSLICSPLCISNSRHACVATAVIIKENPIYQYGKPMKASTEDTIVFKGRFFLLYALELLAFANNDVFLSLVETKPSDNFMAHNSTGKNNELIKLMFY